MNQFHWHAIIVTSGKNMDLLELKELALFVPGVLFMDNSKESDIHMCLTIVES